MAMMMGEVHTYLFSMIVMACDENADICKTAPLHCQTDNTQSANIHFLRSHVPHTYIHHCLKIVHNEIDQIVEKLH